MINLYPKNALFNALNDIIDRGKPISFIFGSPITMPDEIGGPGVPNVDSMISIIEDKISQKDTLDSYIENTAGSKGAEKYQKSFEYICGWHSQDLANSIIEDAIVSGCSKDGGITLDYPPSLDEIAKFINNKRANVQSIITTNFDPLLEICLEKNGIRYHSYILDSDGFINKPNTFENDIIDIYHIHGFWKDSETLHTVSQLTQEREQLSSSLKDVIGNSSIVVIGYGGWDDVLIKSIKDTLNVKRTNSDIIWAFFEESKSKIEERYKKLFDTVSRGLIANRFRCYGNINCKLFFKELNEFIENKNKFPEVIDKKSIGDARSHLRKDAIQDNSPFANLSTSRKIAIKESFIQKKPHHSFIRRVERQHATESLRELKIITITSTTGGDIYGFISSVIYNNIIFEKLPIYKIDAYKIDNQDAFELEFEKQIGINIAPFISIHTQSEGCLLIIDNINGLDLINWRESLNNTLSTILKNSKNIFIVLLGDNTIEQLTRPIVSLTPLNSPDCYEYINHHPHFRQEFIHNNNFHKIISITKSLPEKIDMLLYDLRAMTLEEYIETEINGDMEDNITINELDTTHIPDYQKDVINDLSISENKDNKDCFTILKILTILEYGETFANIKRHYSRFKFNRKSINRLLDYGLVHDRHRVITLSREYRPAGSIVMTVSPLISSYIRKITNADENIEIIKEGLELSLGTHWMSGDVKFNSSVKEQILESHSYGPGNVHSLISQFMRHSIKEQLLREFKAIFYASLCYIDLLYEKGRFNDVILASSDILSICKDFNDVIKTYKLQIRKADGLRMLAMYEEAEIEFNEVLKNNSNLTKKELIEIHIELAHIKEKDNDKVETLKHIREIKKMTHSKSSCWLRAESIAANFLPKQERIKKLSRLEIKARNLNFNHVHHNIQLSIASIISDKEKKLKIYNSVIKSSTDEYTKIRAIIRKSKNIIECGELNQITNTDRETLKDTYIYLFTQRLEKLTDNCHDILWEVYSSEGDIQSLLNLYRHSAIVWWLNGRIEKDYKYLNNLYEKKTLFENTDVNTLYLELIIPRMDHYSQSKTIA